MKTNRSNNGAAALLSWSAVGIVMLAIFYLSSQPDVQSDRWSKRVTKVIADTVKSVMPQEDISIDRWNRVLRKHAHFIAYFVLGISVFHALRNSGVSCAKGTGAALVICVLYAVSDECHQWFVPGRGAQLQDVVIDGVGSMAGIALYGIAGRFWQPSR
jgi:VanZ family protein